MPKSPATQRLRLLSYNIQVGIATAHYGHYLTRGWHHFLPHHSRQDNLLRIAEVVQSYDLVALQETDAGSMRSNYINQVAYLAHHAQFPHWYDQRNRQWGRLAQHSLGLLSRFPVETLQQHKLPGLIRGRGALEAQFATSDGPLLLMVVHLSLGKYAQSLQLDYIAERVRHFQYAIIMGDMNCSMNKLTRHAALKDISVVAHHPTMPTFPSWQPMRHIDHILVSRNISIERVEVLPYCYSDHLPIAVDITLPCVLEERALAKAA